MSAVLSMPPTALRVVMFSNLYPPVVSGSSTQSSSLAHELVGRGCQVTMITARLTNDLPEYEQAAGVHIYRLPAWRLPKLPIALNFPWLSLTFSPANLRRIETILDRHQPQVLHLHNHMFDLAFSAVLMHRRRRIPLVVTIHTMIKHAQSLYNFVLYPLDRLLLKNAVIDQADAVICPDLNMMDYVQEAFRRTDAVMVPYGISAALPPHPDLVEEIRSRYQLGGKRVILSLGHVHEIRNRKDLVEAMPEVLKVFPNTVLLIVGVVATQSPAEAARRLGIESAVIFAGHQPHAHVSALFELADLEAHWLTQDIPERTSLGIATMEAMNAGKTILAVANENTFGPGVLVSGENLIVVEPGKPEPLAQTIIALLGDDDRRTAIGRNARQTIRTHFSWDAICEKTLSLYLSFQCPVPQDFRRAA